MSLYSFDDMAREANQTLDATDRLRAEFERTRITGTAGDDEVTVTALASGAIINVRISDEALRRRGAGDLSGLVLAAVQSAVANAASHRMEALEPILGAAASMTEVNKYIERVTAQLRAGQRPEPFGPRDRRST